MTVGDTLLKITDYPFVYSIGFILIGLAGYSLSDPKSLAFFALAGFAGTFLAIVDPFGKGVRLYFMSWSQRRFKKTKDTQIVNEWNYFRSAFFTRSIEIEKDKLVSSIYFQISILVFILALSSNTFAGRLSLEISGNVICNLHCVQHTLVSGLVIVFFIIFGMMIWNGYNMTKKVDIVATYLFCIISPKATKESIENISKFIDLGDWKTAEYWQNKLQEDVKYSRGQKEIVIKSAESVYKPLIAEFTRIETQIDNIPLVRRYSTINFGSWNTIKANLTHLVVDDPKFRERLDTFDDKTFQHDILVDLNNAKIIEIINKIFSKIHDGRNITSIEYFVGTEKETMPIDLVTCVFCNINPRDYDLTRKPYGINMKWLENNVMQQELMTSDDVLEKFDKGWNEIRNNVENDPEYKKMKDLLNDIRTENLELLKISMERFELQYRV